MSNCQSKIINASNKKQNYLDNPQSQRQIAILLYTKSNAFLKRFSDLLKIEGQWKQLIQIPNIFIYQDPQEIDNQAEINKFVAKNKLYLNQFQNFLYQINYMEIGGQSCLLIEDIQKLNECVKQVDKIIRSHEKLRKYFDLGKIKFLTYSLSRKDKPYFQENWQKACLMTDGNLQLICQQFPDYYPC